MCMRDGWWVCHTTPCVPSPPLHSLPASPPHLTRPQQPTLPQLSPPNSLLLSPTHPPSPTPPAGVVYSGSNTDILFEQGTCLCITPADCKLPDNPLYPYASSGLDRMMQRYIEIGEYLGDMDGMDPSLAGPEFDYFWWGGGGGALVLIGRGGSPVQVGRWGRSLGRQEAHSTPRLGH